MSKPGIGAFVALLCGLTAFAQEPRDRTMAQATMDGTSRVSSTVMATYHLSGAPGSPNYAVTYVILWRGEPGWMGNGNTKTIAASGSGTFRRLVGSHVLDVTVDGASATVAGTVVDLRKTNAIFVDRIDRPSATKVVDTRLVDVPLPKTLRSHELTRILFGGLPTLAGFAGCDAPSPGTPDSVACAQLNAVTR
jgi:hypothetical protein